MTAFNMELLIKAFNAKENFTDNGSHRILRLNILPNISFTTRALRRDY